MDEPLPPLAPDPVPAPPPFPQHSPRPAVLAGDPRGWPQARAGGSNKTVIGIAIGGCAFILFGFIAFVVFLAWVGSHADHDVVRGSGKPGLEQPADGKPGATADRGTDPSRWITSDDYPADALDRGDEGTVAIAWEVSPDGLPLRCTVEQSSGHPSLDNAACAAIMRHAQYAALPAGQVTVRRETRRVVWRLPENAGGGK